ncbi:hypothetical protein Tco_0292941 [Tanacetum coccineum]
MRILLRKDYKSFPMILRLFSDLLCSSDHLLVSGITSIRRILDGYGVLSLGSSIYSVWNHVDTPYPPMWDMAYWALLEHGYAIAFLMDTAYWSSE